MRRSPKETEQAAGLVTRRGVVLGGLQVGFISILALRMRQMQVTEADSYRLLAEENRINVRLIPPSRGIIFDRFGIPIAQNAQNYRVVIVREDVDDVDEAIAKVRRLIQIDEQDIERARKEMARRSPFVPITLVDQLAWEDIAEIAINAPALPGITPDVGLSREYPLGADFAHIVGYVGPVSDYDLEKLENPNPLLQIPEFQIGKIGVETKLETQLRGRAGTRRIEVNAGGRVMRELSRDDYTAGQDLQLTIDHGLQNYAQARLADESAGSVVIDVESGDLLAMASTPSFDPNLFVRGISSKDYGSLRENKFKPLFNKTVQGLYPPGSTFKMMTGLAALRAGVIGQGETVYCPGHMSLGGRRFHCWKRGGHGWMDLNNAITQSCDVYFYEISGDLGIDNIHEYLLRFGLGNATGIDMVGERPGLVPSREWKRNNFRDRDNQRWYHGETVIASIGQGFMLATPLQLAVATATLATRGERFQPRIVAAVEDAMTGERSVGQPVSMGNVDIGNEFYWRNVLDAMHDVLQGPTGTARAVGTGASYEMAGKSGTAQVVSIAQDEEYDEEEIEERLRDHALFVSFAPYDEPKIAVAVIVENGSSGSSVAAPIAKAVMDEYLGYGADESR